MITQQRVLVDIDSLVDTRLGLILEHKPYLYEKIDLSEYRKRVTNVWYKKLGITDEEWDKLWGARSVATLKQSGPTNLLFTLVSELGAKFAATLVGTPLEKPRLTVNIWPYKLNKDERALYLENLKDLYSSCTLSVDLINQPIEKITPEFIKTNFDAVFIYDFHNWIDTHVKELSEENGRMPSKTVYSPALLRSDTMDVAADQMVTDKVNPFTETKKFCATAFTLELVDAGLFSLRHSNHPESSADPQQQ